MIVVSKIKLIKISDQNRACFISAKNREHFLFETHKYDCRMIKTSLVTAFGYLSTNYMITFAKLFVYKMCFKGICSFLRNLVDNLHCSISQFLEPQEMLSKVAETQHNKEDWGLDTFLWRESCPKTSSLRNKLAGHNNDHLSCILIDFLVYNHGMFDLNRIFLPSNVDPYNIHGIF